MIESHTMLATEAAISSVILTAPGWVRVGITAPSERIREEAAQELARAILASTKQLPLAL
jgi:hypothetical protein